jgi:hypothetical protein
MAGSSSSYAAASIAFEFIGAHKPPHLATKCFRQGGDTIEGDFLFVFSHLHVELLVVQHIHRVIIVSVLF